MERPKVKNQHNRGELLIGIEVSKAFMIQIMTLRLFIETRAVFGLKSFVFFAIK